MGRLDPKDEIGSLNHVRLMGVTIESGTKSDIYINF